MQNISEWMTGLQHQQRSPASSYAETDSADSDSDSDSSCDDCQRRFDAKRKFMAKDAEHVWARTAPIRIPSSGRQQPHPHLCENVAESPDLSYHADMRLLRAGRYLHEDEESHDEVDEDDPAFYGNLAFFRSQYGTSQTRMVKRSVHPFKAAAAPTSPTGVDDRDEDIFAMEL